MESKVRHSKVLRQLSIFLGISLIVFTAGVVNAMFYPFTTTHPNYSDVERVFNKIQFPADWQQIDQSENRGIAGRQCPIEPGSVCFHKSETFGVGKDISADVVKGVLLQTGCPAVSITEHKVIEGTPYTTFECTVGGVNLTGEIDYKKEVYQVYVSVST